MSFEKTSTLLCATLAFLLLQGNQVYMQVANLSCLMGDASFDNSTLDRMIHCSDVVLGGRILSAREGEFGAYTAVVSYLKAYKFDDLLHRKFGWFSSIVDFNSSPEIYRLGIFFLIRHQSTMQLSLLCMSTEVGNPEILSYITELGLNDTKRNNETVPVYPSICDSVPSRCGAGAFCSAITAPSRDRYWCPCLPGFYRNKASNECLSRTAAVPDLYCPNCSHNARCFRTSETSSNSYDIITECRCNHITCENMANNSLCGSDERNYTGKCQMRMEACRQQKDINRLYGGACRSEIAQPCLGHGNPLTSSVGLVRCMNHSSCPVQYFCYSVPESYSVCCPALQPKPTSSQPIAPTQAITTPTTSSPTTISEQSGSGSGANFGSGDTNNDSNDDDDHDLGSG